MTTENGTCVLCGRPITGWGNNPYPLAEDGECCDQCNTLVIEARLIRAIRAQGEPSEVRRHLQDIRHRRRGAPRRERLR